MVFSQATLDMADRHVAEAERHVAVQEGVISRLHQCGASTQMAEELLKVFQDLLDQHRRLRDLAASRMPPTADE